MEEDMKKIKEAIIALSTIVGMAEEREQNAKGNDQSYSVRRITGHIKDILK